MQVWEQDGVWHRQIDLWVNLFQLSDIYGWILDETKIIFYQDCAVY